MGFSFSTIEPNQLGSVTKFDIPVNEWMGLKFSQGFADTLGTARYRMEEDRIWDDGNFVRPDVANRSFGIEGELKFDQPVSIQRARLMHERKRAELERRAYLDSASHSWASAKAVAGFGASLVGSIAHPLDLGMTFLPFIGSEKAAASVAKLGASSWRSTLLRGLERGVIPEEALARAGVPYHRLSGSIIDGVVNQAVMEIPIALQKHRDQADYTTADSVFNILAGGAFAGAIKGLGLALERAGKFWREADPRIKDAAVMDVARTILTGENPKAGQYFSVDEAAIRAKVEGEVRARNPFAEPTPHPESGGRDNAIGSGQPVIRFESPDAKVGDTFDDAGAKYKVSSVQETTVNGTTTRQAIATKDGFDIVLETIAQKEARGIELTEAETARVESLIDPETPTAHAEYQQRVSQIEQELGKGKLTDETRQRSVEDLLSVQKAEHEAKIKGIIDVETRKAMDDLRRAQPAPPAEQTQRYTIKSVPDDANIKVVDEDSAVLEQGVLSMATSPEERLRLETEIKNGVEHVEEFSGEKAVDEMLPCVVNRSKL